MKIAEQATSYGGSERRSNKWRENGGEKKRTGIETAIWPKKKRGGEDMSFISWFRLTLSLIVTSLLLLFPR